MSNISCCLDRWTGNLRGKQQLEVSGKAINSLCPKQDVFSEIAGNAFCCWQGCKNCTLEFVQDVFMDTNGRKKKKLLVWEGWFLLYRHCSSSAFVTLLIPVGDRGHETKGTEMKYSWSPGGYKNVSLEPTSFNQLS